MERLDFSLPEFTRIIWSSEHAKQVWEHRLQAIGRAWNHIERTSVVHGVRRGGLQSVAPDDLLDFQAYCLNAQINFAIVARDGIARVYGNSAIPYHPGQPWQYRVYFGADPKGFNEAWRDSEQLVIGDYLGYPQCCSEFFQKYWVEEGWRDLTLPQARFKDGPVEGSYLCNLLLRHLGVRAVFHLPCSFDCDKSIEVGNRILDCGRLLGYEIEMQWIMEILNWPIKWSSLHGVSIITTPVVKVIASTDALPEKVELVRKGSMYPEEGAKSNEFPFQLRRSLLEGIRDTWTENGFSSYQTQREAHDLVLEAIETIMLDSGRILDLGCGNGVLLERVNKKFEYLIPHGVEMETARYWSARERIGENITNTNVFNIEAYLHPNFEVILISLNRFREIPEDAVENFLICLKHKTKYLVVYSYEGWYDYLDYRLQKHFDFVGTHQSSVYDVRILKPK